MRRPGSTGGSWATESVATFRWMPAHRRGVAAGVAAYLLWGVFPLFWPLLEPAAPVEILAHRIAWSLVFVAGLLALTAGLRWGGGPRRPGARVVTPPPRVGAGNLGPHNLRGHSPDRRGEGPGDFLKPPLPGG